jgi:alpha-tubulin suppressor-like RCC1 family protein
MGMVNSRILFLALLVLACDGPTRPDGAIDKIEVSGPAGPIPAGVPVALSIKATDAAGKNLSDRTFEWSSSDSAIATISQSGVVRGGIPGTATITASSEGKSGQISIVVVLGSPSFLTIAPANSVVYPLTFRLLTATTRDAAGNVLPTGAVTWTSSDPNRVLVQPSGTANGRHGEGGVEVTASADGLTGTTTVTLRPISTISLGDYHGCSLARDGTASCWGRNVNGELGTGSVRRDTALSPRRVSGAVKFVKLSSGGSHTCALSASGSAYCWGANADGELGDGTRTVRNSPVPVSGGLTFSDIASGKTHTCGIAGTSDVFCWGDGVTAPRRIESSVDLVSIVAGDRFTCGLDALGVAYCWGINASGELGSGSTTPSAVPAEVAGNHRFRVLSAGGPAVCGIAVDGPTWCWGRLRWTDSGDRSIPENPPGAMRFTSVSVSESHLCGITIDMRGWCIGMPGDGEMGNGVRYGFEVAGVPTLKEFVGLAGSWTNLASIATGWGSSCAVTDAGTPLCWGYWARIGTGSDLVRWLPTTQAVPE